MESALRRVARDVAAHSALCWPSYKMRQYQIEPARAIANSVRHRLGLQFALVFCRQSGKDETIAQTISYLLTIFQLDGGTIVMGAPTQEPQASTSRDRLTARLRTSPLVDKNKVRTRDGYIVEVGQASARYLSASQTANPRGQTASLLLIANEAQDIDPGIWDARFDPMAASTNATTVYIGTVWTRTGLLSRQIAHLEQLERDDGIKRVFRIDWEMVAKEVPAYGDRVRARIAQFGANHPYIKTEYMLQELDGEGGLFGPERLAQLQGEHQRRRRNDDGGTYCLLIDVAGSDETGSGPESYDNAAKRDSTALTVVRVDTTIRPHRYEIVDRRAWTNVPIQQIERILVDLAQNVWKAAAVVVDATGIGQGLASFLMTALQHRYTKRLIHVLPFVFTSASKSALGWDFLALIDSGRIKDYTEADQPSDTLRTDFATQMSQVTYEILSGPNKLLRWSVPTSHGHDDLVMSAALCSQLDEIPLAPRVAKGQ